MQASLEVPGFNSITRQRFDVRAAYARDPIASAMGREYVWLESVDLRFLALALVDGEGDHVGILFARDRAERFRAVGTAVQSDAEALLDEITRLYHANDSVDATIQGDERPTIDFFTERETRQPKSANYDRLAAGAGFEAAREVISDLMRWYDDVDGNFVEQFQTTGFDARLWETYLFATFVEQEWRISRPDPAPDFLIETFEGDFCVEATTANAPATMPDMPKDADERADYLENYVPTRVSGPLTAKLAKRYWERGASLDKPLVVAIQDFHARLSMTYSAGALQSYLYGLRIVERPDGSTGVETINEHRWGEKTVPSNFFGLPDSQNISAVLINPSGTLSKFNRIGVGAGFPSDAILVHRGFGLRRDGPEEFSHIVSSGYKERWIDGAWVFHNPHALRPLPPGAFVGAAHVYRTSTGLESIVPDGHIDSSVTFVTHRPPS